MSRKTALGQTVGDEFCHILGVKRATVARANCQPLGRSKLKSGGAPQCFEWKVSWAGSFRG